jgi:hypothetical protein
MCNPIYQHPHLHSCRITLSCREVAASCTTVGKNPVRTAGDCLVLLCRLRPSLNAEGHVDFASVDARYIRIAVQREPE